MQPLEQMVHLYSPQVLIGATRFTKITSPNLNHCTPFCEDRAPRLAQTSITATLYEDRASANVTLQIPAERQSKQNN